MTSSTAKSPSIARSSLIGDERGAYLMAFDSRLSMMARIFSPSPTTIAGESVASKVSSRAKAASLCSRITRRSTSVNATGPSVCGSMLRV